MRRDYRAVSEDQFCESFEAANPLYLRGLAERKLPELQMSQTWEIWIFSEVAFGEPTPKLAVIELKRGEMSCTSL